VAIVVAREAEPRPPSGITTLTPQTRVSVPQVALMS
jgi:hypothetical protein